MVFLQPNLSTAASIGFLMLAMLFVAGANLGHLAVILTGAVGAMVGVWPGGEGVLPTIVHGRGDGLESETLILRFDMQGFGVSGGSACSSHSLEPSHVLRSLGIDADRAHGALRISMGRYTDEADVEAFAVAMEKSLNWN